MRSATTPAHAATTAETTNASVKPWSVGIPATALAARIVAETCEPRDEPTERPRSSLARPRAQKRRAACDEKYDPQDHAQSDLDNEFYLLFLSLLERGLSPLRPTSLRRTAVPSGGRPGATGVPRRVGGHRQSATRSPSFRRGDRSRSRPRPDVRVAPTPTSASAARLNTSRFFHPSPASQRAASRQFHRGRSRYNGNTKLAIFRRKCK